MIEGTTKIGPIDPKSEFISDSYSMFSGSEEAESRRYHKVCDKRGRVWLYSDQEDAASNIYVEGGPGSDGFGGREITFPLVDGGEVKLRGPWHTNSGALMTATGVDLRDRHLTLVVVALERVEIWPKTVLRGVIYRDDKPVLGRFDRGDEIAQRIADELNVSVYCYQQSKGGSTSGLVKSEVGSNH